MKTIAILGSTGSIGTTSLKIIKRYRKLFKLVLLFAGKNYKKLNSQCKIYKPEFICLNNKKYFKRLIPKFKKLSSIDEFLKKTKKIDYVISAVSGYSALDINFKLLKKTKKLLIANKETIICGGKVFLKVAKKYKCKIIPIDSEHFCINFFLDNFKKKNIRKFYLTASGGPFLNKKIKKNVSLKQVLKHPNWKMGKKNSINSANMTNKVMELFEAHFLFRIPEKKLDIKIEKTSKVHSIISINNGLDFLISHDNNMEIPIENSLFDDENYSYRKKNISYFDDLHFKLSNVNYKMFPVVNTGRKVLKLGHRAMIIFTVLNDRLVEMFLKNKIKFYEITMLLNNVFSKFKIVNYSKKSIRNLFDIKKTINFAKNINL